MIPGTQQLRAPDSARTPGLPRSLSFAVPSRSGGHFSAATGALSSESRHHVVAVFNREPERCSRSNPIVSRMFHNGTPPPLTRFWAHIAPTRLKQALKHGRYRPFRVMSSARWYYII